MHRHKRHGAFKAHTIPSPLQAHMLWQSSVGIDILFNNIITTSSSFYSILLHNELFLLQNKRDHLAHLTTANLNLQDTLYTLATLTFFTPLVDIYTLHLTSNVLFSLLKLMMTYSFMFQINPPAYWKVLVGHDVIPNEAWSSRYSYCYVRTDVFGDRQELSKSNIPLKSHATALYFERTTPSTLL